MQELIDIFRMSELSVQTRVRIIIQLGIGINHREGGNFTEGIVYELVKALDPENKQVETDFYRKMAGLPPLIKSDTPISVNVTEDVPF